MTSISVLGSTGVVGQLTLDVLEHLGEGYRVHALAAGENVTLLAQQIVKWSPRCVSVASESARLDLLALLAGTALCPEVYVGDEGLCAVADVPADIVVSAVVGARGLRPTWRALRRGATVALANKETLVAAGDLVMPFAAAQAAQIIPVDSEHSALFQCLQGERPSTVSRYWITASGGPFRTWTADAMHAASVEQALQHPTWSMGKKITVDSATLMNKGLEVIEAHHLFDVSYDKIQVVVHPQSVVHSMVEFQDGALMAQLGTHDMRVPIQYALTYPHRQIATWPKLDLPALAQLTFEQPDGNRFPCLELAFAAGRAGGYAPCVMNAANEVAVSAALEHRVPLRAIARIVEDTMSACPTGAPTSVDDVLGVDVWARGVAESVIQRGGWNG